MTEVVDKPVVPEGCICIPPLIPLADKAMALKAKTNGTGILQYEIALGFSVFGVIIARSVAETKHYGGYLSQTHRQCPVHDSIFWPRVAEERPALGTCERNHECAGRAGHEGDCIITGSA